MVSLRVNNFDPNDLLSNTLRPNTEHGQGTIGSRIEKKCKHDSRLEMDHHYEPPRLVTVRHWNFQLENDVQYILLKS